MNSVGSYDANTGTVTGELGGDVFWKPSSSQQLSTNVNPDFSQVESDDIVINFSPDEIFFREKRSFFTENRGFLQTSPLMDL